MVRAILEGRKTQTRRIVKPQPTYRIIEAQAGVTIGMDKSKDGALWYDANGKDPGREVACPHGQPGDRLWVRETWGPCDGGACYRASERPTVVPDGGKWKPSIFMPRQASRITLEIVSVRVERLQDISPDDCRAEGMPRENNDIGVRYGYGQLWNSINGKGSWDLNPWVWVIQFKRVEAQ